MLDEGPYTVREHFNGPVNHPHKEIYKQLRENIRRQLPQVCPYPPNDYKALILCGGPSLNRFTDEIKKKRASGWKLVTVNGTHDWALDHGMVPSMHVAMDARPMNVKFFSRPQKKTRYLLAGQVHGDVFDALDGHDVHIWHGGAPSSVEKRILDSFYGKRWFDVWGGSSVGPRAIILSYILGIRELEVFGLDSCLMGKKRHHAYSQPENDFGVEYIVKVHRKKFRMHGWMLKQFDEWLQLAPRLPDELRLTLKGNGALSYVTELFAKTKEPPKMEVLDIVKVY